MTSPSKTEQKNHTYRNILQSASRLMREHGIAGTSVADVMSGAGLTVGGFYAHFSSKEALFNQTLVNTSRTMWTTLLSVADGKDRVGRVRAILASYLSAAHRDEPTEGCALPSIAADVTRLGEPYRSSLAGEIDAFAAGLGPIVGGRAARKHALALIALMLGGMSLARALRGTALSDEVLSACRSFGMASLDAKNRGTT